MPTLITIWTVVTVALVALSIHRSILVMREEDVIFLSQGETARAGYADVLKRLKRVELFLKVLSFTSGALVFVIAALWAYRGLYGL